MLLAGVCPAGASCPGPAGLKKLAKPCCPYPKDRTFWEETIGAGRQTKVHNSVFSISSLPLSLPSFSAVKARRSCLLNPDKAGALLGLSHLTAASACSGLTVYAGSWLLLLQCSSFWNCCFGKRGSALPSTACYACSGGSSINFARANISPTLCHILQFPSLNILCCFKSYLKRFLPFQTGV